MSLTPPNETNGPREAAGNVATDRGISPISRGLGSGMAGKAVTVAALIAGCGALLAANWGHAPKKPKAAQEPARQVVDFEPALGPAPTLAHPGQNPPTLSASTEAAHLASEGLNQSPAPTSEPGGAKTEIASRAEQIAAIRSAPILAFVRPDPRAAPEDAVPELQPAQIPAQGAKPSELDGLREGSAIGLVHAKRLPDRNFLIAAGSAIPCVLQTAMDTATPGYVSCLVGQDIYSDNGSVILMEKGAKVMGEYRSSLRQGQRRLFVLWTRAVTPAGVAIRLDSPATDAMGRAGFDGDIDTHFWERFGGALMLSIVDDTSAAAAARNNFNGETARIPSDAAAVALQNSINIPPSLKKPQGSQVAIFVAQDIDFSSVYRLSQR